MCCGSCTLFEKNYTSFLTFFFFKYVNKRKQSVRTTIFSRTSIKLDSIELLSHFNPSLAKHPVFSIYMTHWSTAHNVSFGQDVLVFFVFVFFCILHDRYTVINMTFCPLPYQIQASGPSQQSWEVWGVGLGGVACFIQV